MEALIKEFINSTDPQKSPNDISNGLTSFRLKINPELCRNVKSPNRINFFISIFDTLLTCCENDSSSVRISSFTASTAFLSKMIRSYPVEIQKAFSTFATKLVSPRKGSVLIVFIFSYIATFITGFYFDEFFNSVPLYHHIVNCDSSSEDFSHIIQNFPNQMSLENYITILISFINQYQKTRNSKLLIPIQKIVEKCVSLDKKSNTAFEEVYKSKDITLIAFIFTSIEVNCDDFDFHEIALNALQKLKTANLSERDDCLLFLSIKSKSFHVDCQKTDTDVLRISIDDKFTDLNIKEFSEVPYFYSLFLPNSLLLPNREKDSLSVISVKFNTIGRILSNRNNIIDVEDYIDLFCQFLVNDLDPIQQYQLNKDSYQQEEKNDDNNEIVYVKKMKYDEVVSSALKAFAVSLPCLITNAKNHRLILILKSIFRTKIASWMHGLDILKVIHAMKDKLLDYISLKERMNILLDFSMNPNEKLSSQAINLIIEMSTKKSSMASSKFLQVSNFYQVTLLVANSIDLFSPQSLIIKLRILAEIIKKNPDENRNHLEWVASILASIYQDYIVDLYVLSEIFNFMQFFSNPYLSSIKINNQNIIQMNEKLNDISFSILIYSLYYMKGCDYLNRASSDYSFYQNLVDRYLNSKTIDIVSNHPFDFKLNFPLISNVYSFFLSSNTPDSASFSSRKKNFMFLIELFFDYFPLESSKSLFLIDDIQLLSQTITEFPTFSDTILFSNYYSTSSYSIILNSSLLSTSASISMNLLTYLFSKLIIVTDPNVFSIWMRNLPKNESLVMYAIYFLENSNHINGTVLDANNFDSLSYFLHGFGIKYEKHISSSLLNIDPSISADYILLALSHSDFILKYNKEINKNSAAFREDFDKMDDKFKMEYIKKYVIFDSDENDKANIFEKKEPTRPNTNSFKVIITQSLIDYGVNHLHGWEKMAFLLKCQEKVSKQKQPKINYEFKDIPKKNLAFNSFFKMNIKDRIQNILQLHIYTNNTDWIEYTLRLSVIKSQVIDFDDPSLKSAILSSSLALIVVTKFIKKRNKIMKRNNSTQPPKLLQPPFDANLFLKYLYIKGHVRKREILQAYRVINLIDPKSSIVFDIYRKYHSCHVKYVLALLAGFVSHVRSMQKKLRIKSTEMTCALDSDFVDFFFKSIKEDANEENMRYASIAAYFVATTYLKISKKPAKEATEINDNDNSNADDNEDEKASINFISEESALSIRYLFGICGLNSVELSTLFSTMIAVIFAHKSTQKALKAEEKLNQSIEENPSPTDRSESSNASAISQNSTSSNEEKNESSTKSSSVVIGNLNDTLNHFINGDLPSQIQAAVRIISRSISSMRDQSIEIIEPHLENLITKTIEFCRPILPTTPPSIIIISALGSNSSQSDFSTNNVDLILKYSKCGNCPFLALSVAKLLRTILQSNAFTELYQIIANYSIKLCETSSEFASNLTGILIKKLHPSEDLFNIFCKISSSQFESKSVVSSKQDKNTTNYLSISDLHFFIECFAGKARKISNKENRESSILNYVYLFIQNFKGYDNWDLFEIYLAWINFIENNLLINDIDHIYDVIFKVISEQFMPNSPRFFPIFAVMAVKARKYLSLNCKDSAEIDNRRKIINTAIDNAISLSNNDAHIYALTKLKEESNLKEALEIAQLEIDDK